MKSLWMLLLLSAVLVSQGGTGAFPTTLLSSSEVGSWVAGRDGPLVPGPNCRVVKEEASVLIVSGREDPYVFLPPLRAVGPLRLEIVSRTSDSVGEGQVYWTTADSPTFAEDKRATWRFAVQGEWTRSVVDIPDSREVTGLRLDPGSGPGTVGLRSVLISSIRWHPLRIERMKAHPLGVQVEVRNAGREPVVLQAELPRTLAPEEMTSLVTKASGTAAFERLSVRVQGEGLTPLTATVWKSREEVALVDPLVLSSGPLRWELDVTAGGARLWRDKTLLAVLYPLLLCDDELPELTATKTDDRVSLQWEGGAAEFRWLRDELEFRVASTKEQRVEGPRVKAVGALEQGLLPGVEYLGKGEASSSRADIDTEEHVRFRPDVLHLTMPLMAFVTDRGTVALHWTEEDAQPVFATPDVFDGSPHHVMGISSLRQVSGRVEFGPSFAQGGRVEDAVRASLAVRGLPAPVPPAMSDLRGAAKEALTGALYDGHGWGHCVEESWPRHPYADHCSWMWRLTGELPELTSLVPGGAHLSDPLAWFLTGRMAMYRDRLNADAAALRRSQSEDGSFRYEGRWLEGHFENTASGFCGARAVTLLEHARFTGDPESLAAGLKALRFIQSFRTPRGAQTWEVSLHTPDIMAAAHVTKACVLAFEATSDPVWIALAERWALRGVPFVSQSFKDPRRQYSTIAVFGATHRKAPNWIGLPVQWCGLVYADALLYLAEHSKASGHVDPVTSHSTATIDWRLVAEGIVRSAEMQLSKNGANAGCLPDSYDLRSGAGRGPFINPCALLQLDARLRGERVLPHVGRAAGDVVLSPFPVTVTGKTALVEGPEGVAYEILINGRVVRSGVGRAVIPLP